MHRTREALIRSRDGMTRFSYAWGPLCRWPGLTPDQVRERVYAELAVQTVCKSMSDSAGKAPQVSDSAQGDRTRRSIVTDSAATAYAAANPPRGAAVP